MDTNNQPKQKTKTKKQKKCFLLSYLPRLALHPKQRQNYEPLCIIIITIVGMGFIDTAI